jgi:Zn-dependent protease
MSQRALSPRGTFRLFQAWGIDVFLHWTWLLVAFYEIQLRQGRYTSLAWNVLEYVTLFAIVLAHEFGHALACRSVGGLADRIMLWPLGGAAYVSPPPRPGAVLWSIVAGPLVNVALALLLWRAPELAISRGMSGDVVNYIDAVQYINLGLLFFNLLPIYPLDGGKIVWALLWFVIGQARALMVATATGLAGAVAIGVLALYFHQTWFAVLAGLGAWQSWVGLKLARAARKLDVAPRHTDATCPACGAHPPAGDFWQCTRCGLPFDTFAHGATCPRCAAQFGQTRCGACGQTAPFPYWYPGGYVPASPIGGADFNSLPQGRGPSQADPPHPPKTTHLPW